MWNFVRNFIARSVFVASFFFLSVLAFGISLKCRSVSFLLFYFQWVPLISFPCISYVLFIYYKSFFSPVSFAQFRRTVVITKWMKITKPREHINAVIVPHRNRHGIRYHQPMIESCVNDFSFLYWNGIKMRKPNSNDSTIFIRSPQRKCYKYMKRMNGRTSERSWTVIKINFEYEYFPFFVLNGRGSSQKVIKLFSIFYT